MTARIIIGAEEAAERLTGATIDSAEFVNGETESEDYAVLRVGTVTLYADAPTVYADAEMNVRSTPTAGRHGHPGPGFEPAPASTLATLFAEGQRIPDLDHDDFHELIDLVLEEHARRVGYDVEIVATTTPEGV